MQKSKLTTQDSAHALHYWFGDVLQSCDPVFALSASPTHREAIVQSFLTSNAKLVVHSKLDHDGEIYPALCKTLAAACRKLSVEMSVGHWQAALQNVFDASSQFNALRNELGLALGSPASIYKSLVDEALINAGVTDQPTILVEENRRAALGLAINWGIRFLLVYAVELRPRGHNQRRRAHDIWWIRGLVDSRAAK